MLSAHQLLWAGLLPVKPSQAESPAFKSLLATAQKGPGNLSALLLRCAVRQLGLWYKIWNQHFQGGIAGHFHGFSLPGIVGWTTLGWEGSSREGASTAFTWPPRQLLWRSGNLCRAPGWAVVMAGEAGLSSCPERQCSLLCLSFPHGKGLSGPF